MKRFFAILMMLLLPFQMTLAAVVAIEMGAASVPASMQGQEECHHQMADLAASDDISTDGTHPGHGNCGICHFSCCSALPTPEALAPVFSATHSPTFASVAPTPTPPAARPERPKWRGLA